MHAARSASADDRPSSALVLRAGRRSDVFVFEGAVVGFFLEAADLLGVPKSVAAIYGLVFASAEPLSFADIEARLDISKGSISQGLRVLREVGALKISNSVSLNGTKSSLSFSEVSRRDHYEPDLELRKLISHFIEQRLEQQLDSGRGALQSVQKRIPAGNEEAAKILKARLKALQVWHEQARAVLPLVKTFLKLT